MKLSKLPKTTTKSKKRVGRGYGSGKGGHTVGRGQKGQKSRGKVGLLFEGTKMRKSLIRRMPMMRGKAKFKSFKEKPVAVNVKYLEFLKSGSEVTVANLIKNGIVKSEALKSGVKILGDGVLTKKLNVYLPVSKGARKKIEKAGGKVLEAKEKIKKVKKEVKEEKKATEKSKPTKKVASKTVKKTKATKKAKVKTVKTKATKVKKK
ncbi:50S ribosomal protein L15 [Patescibacteria group bacterium]